MLERRTAKSWIRLPSRLSSRRRKNANKNLETLLCEGEMHKFRLKAVVYYGSAVENQSKGTNHRMKSGMKMAEGVSDWIVAVNRYEIKIDDLKTNLSILDSASIQVLTIITQHWIIHNIPAGFVQKLTGL